MLSWSALMLGRGGWGGGVSVDGPFGGPMNVDWTGIWGFGIMTKPPWAGWISELLQDSREEPTGSTGAWLVLAQVHLIPAQVFLI